MTGDNMLHARWQSFRHAFAGIAVLVATQPNARIHVLATGVVIVAGIAARISTQDWCLLVLAIALVWVAEALNTAIEFLADAAVPGHHALIKHAKDVAAAAVLLASVAAVLIAGFIFLPVIAQK